MGPGFGLTNTEPARSPGEPGVALPR